MKLELEQPDQVLIPMRSQLLELPDGIILKRGRVELKIIGDTAMSAVKRIFDAAEGGASRVEILDRFKQSERDSVAGLLSQLETRRFLGPLQDAVGSDVDEGTLGI